MSETNSHPVTPEATPASADSRPATPKATPTSTDAYVPVDSKGDLKKLNLADNYLFTKVMMDEELCRRVLQEILQVPIRRVVAVTEEKTIQILPDSKGIRLDVYVGDEAGTVYDVEMQTGRRSELPKRMRYYQGNIDLNLIAKGAKYSELRRSFIIFICTFDPFRSGRHIYTFENTCSKEPDLKFGDETVKLLLNTRGKMDDISSDLRAFLAYVENTTDEFAETTDSQLVRDLQQRVKAIKDSRKFQDEYMTQYMREQEIHDEAYASGLAEGHASGFAEGAENSFRTAILNMRSLGHDDAFIAQCLGISVNDIPTILAHDQDVTAP